MPARSDRSRSPKRVAGEPDIHELQTDSWPGLRASLQRVHEAVQSILSRGEAEADYLSNAQRVQLKQHLDRIAEDALQLGKPKDDEISAPSQSGVVNFKRTKSQVASQKRIEDVRSQFDACQVPMTKLVQSVSLLVEDPFPSDVGRLRDVLTVVERGQKEARNYGEDLLQFMLDLDNISGLVDEDRNFRRNTMRSIDALLANIDDARSRLVTLHRMLDKEMRKQQDQKEALPFRDVDEVQLAEGDAASRRGEIASEEPQSKGALQMSSEPKTQDVDMDSHPAVLQMASLKRTISEVSDEKSAPEEHQVPMSRLARSASLIQEVGTLLSDIENSRKEVADQEHVAAKRSKVDRVDDDAKRRRLQEERQKSAEEEAMHTEAVGKPMTSTQLPLLVPSGPPTTFAPP